VSSARRLLTRPLLVMALCLAAAATTAPAASAAFEDFGIADVDASLSTAEAGAHPDFSTTIEVTTDPASEVDVRGRHRPFAELKDVEVGLPPGLVGNQNAVLTCTLLQFAESEFETPGNATGCPQDSQVGVLIIERYGSERTIVTPLFNLQPPGDGNVVARFGTGIFSSKVFVDAGIRSNGDYGITATAEGISSLGKLISLKTVLWGVPAAASHDTERLTLLESSQGSSSSPPRPSGLAPRPFMTNPTRCGVPLGVSFRATSYQLPEDQVAEADAPLPEMTDCGQVGFAPTLSIDPTSAETASPSGLDATLAIPQSESVSGIATSELRRAKVSLPAGFTLAAGGAEGLGACSAAQVGFASPPAPSSCPDDARIGTVEFDSPALSRVIRGGIYQRTPEPGDLFRVWLVSDELGVHLKLPGEIHPDPSSGQLTAVFDGPPAAEGNPQLPLRSVSLHFKGGPHGVLSTPPRCGDYNASYELEPWSGNAAVSGAAPMAITAACDGGGFGPRLSAGSTSPIAGAFSPFVTNLLRDGREQNVSDLEVTLPPGLLAKLRGVPLCQGAAAASGNCPAGSQVGVSAVAAGPGPSPLWIPQPGKEPTAVYLSGPYRGGPYSLVVRTPAQAGPFDLGTVVVRAGVFVDPESTRVTVKSDPLPQILEGVPISYRDIHIGIDRPNFTLNPTNCSRLQASGSATSVAGQRAALFDPFHVGACAALGFKPRLSLRLRGETKRAGSPALRAAVTFPKGAYANTARATVALPHSEFLDQGHIQAVCTRPQLAAEQCPKGSVYGHATANSPLLDRALEGPVYLGTGYGHELPDLVADLHGQIHVILRGRIDTNAQNGIRTTFGAVPDAPVSKFTLTMKGGRKSLLENSEDLCASGQLATARFTAQNGRRLSQRPVLRTPCSHRARTPHR